MNDNSVQYPNKQLFFFFLKKRENGDSILIYRYRGRIHPKQILVTLQFNMKNTIDTRQWGENATSQHSTLLCP